MRKREYYRTWLQRAFSKPLGYAAAISLVVTIFGGLASSLYPDELGTVMSYLLWALPLVVFLGTSVVGFLLAPFYMHSDVVRERYMANKELSDIKTHRLQLEVEPIGLVNKDNQTIWNHLIVHNVGKIPVENCYGELVSFIDTRKYIDPNDLPQRTVRYAWTSDRGGSDCRTSNIGVEGKDCLDIMYVDAKKSLLYTPVLGKDNWSRVPLYPLPPGMYESIVLVGSETQAFPPEKIRLNISYQGGLRLEVIGKTI
jgi:hypothetical protein